MTTACPGESGAMSRNASTLSSSYNLCAGISPRKILLKTVSGMARVSLARIFAECLRDRPSPCSGAEHALAGLDHEIAEAEKPRAGRVGAEQSPLLHQRQAQSVDDGSHHQPQVLSLF